VSIGGGGAPRGTLSTLWHPGEKKKEEVMNSMSLTSRTLFQHQFHKPPSFSCAHHVVCSCNTSKETHIRTYLCVYFPVLAVPLYGEMAYSSCSCLLRQSLLVSFYLSFPLSCAFFSVSAPSSLQAARLLSTLLRRFPFLALPHTAYFYSWHACRRRRFSTTGWYSEKWVF
jgi:hypothetical protein